MILMADIKSHLEARILEIWEEDEKLQHSGEFLSYAQGQVRGRLFELLGLWDSFEFETNNEQVNIVLDWYHQ